MVEIQLFFLSNLICDIFNIIVLSFKSIGNKCKIAVDVQ